MENIADFMFSLILEKGFVQFFPDLLLGMVSTCKKVVNCFSSLLTGWANMVGGGALHMISVLQRKPFMHKFLQCVPLGGLKLA